MEHLRYPIGSFEPVMNPSIEERTRFINQIPDITKILRKFIAGTEPEQLNTPHRQGAWSTKQIVHHMADNDMNAYIRFKKALTEDEPMSGTYREDLWAELSDYKDVPIEHSLVLLETLHIRFVILLNGLQLDDFSRKLKTEVLGSITLDTALQRFVWHNEHHISQIQSYMMSKG
ncbi:YfiT family bacillithiol transferase [Paenibacillus sp. 481]|uniref:YfiT family bacillithiol transferase n=1 Tax=Paenibacillus sp. 481 TaxID=2835869 RepID=UPI001E5C1BA1|nr:putative metal-dependent hydrolase [Paenibacillus sp. 481]UHA71925.1 putative metal-dependent hydrolase [Paenibacillus sp. 481]